MQEVYLKIITRFNGQAEDWRMRQALKAENPYYPETLKKLIKIEVVNA